MTAESNESNQPAQQPTAPAHAPEPTAAKSGGLLSGPFGLMAAIALFGIAGYQFYTKLIRAPAVAAEPVPRRFLCVETDQTFTYARKPDEALPVMSPHSGKRTGYPCYPCFWTEDGKIKDKPNYVILNRDLGKEGPTLCPECGRLITGHEDDPRFARAFGEQNADGDPPDADPTSAPAGTQPADPQP